MSASEDTALIAGQLADLTRKVDEMAEQLRGLRGDADDAQLRADTQQERIDLAARELAEVSDRLQAAANALRESIWLAWLARTLAHAGLRARLSQTGQAF
jgi:methyl-accepting chemotaxis protein